MPIKILLLKKTIDSPQIVCSNNVQSDKPVRRKKKYSGAGSLRVPIESPGRWEPDGMRDAWRSSPYMDRRGHGEKKKSLSIRDVRHTLIAGDMKVSRKRTKSHS